MYSKNSKNSFFTSTRLAALNRELHPEFTTPSDFLDSLLKNRVLPYSSFIKRFLLGRFSNKSICSGLKYIYLGTAIETQFLRYLHRNNIYVILVEYQSNDSYVGSINEFGDEFFDENVTLSVDFSLHLYYHSDLANYPDFVKYVNGDENIFRSDILEKADNIPNLSDIVFHYNVVSPELIEKTIARISNNNSDQNKNS